MNVLFLGLGKYLSVSGRGIYLDLMRVFRSHGHHVCIVGSMESGKDAYTLQEEDGAFLLRVRTGRIVKTNLIEKGINTLLVEPRYIKAIDACFRDVKFDLVLYPTPPITFLNVVKHIKKRDGAVSYLMLKDIFPQNAVDLGMMKKSGPKSVMYSWFRQKEKNLYAVSDHIGCMSQANVEYLLKHNPEIPSDKVGICPNSTDIVDQSVSEEKRGEIRKKYRIPEDRTVFIYGGNLGKPQGIPFLIECLKACRDLEDAFFLVIGNGTEYGKLEKYAQQSGQQNFRLMQRLPKEDYDAMAGAADVGMIFLDHRFTIPNFPSRLLSCLSAKLPVLAVTDPNTDIGKVIEEGKFGWWCESNDAQKFRDKVCTIMKTDRSSMKEAAFAYLKEHYSSEHVYRIITETIGWKEEEEKPHD